MVKVVDEVKEREDLKQRFSFLEKEVREIFGNDIDTTQGYGMMRVRMKTGGFVVAIHPSEESFRVNHPDYFDKTMELAQRYEARFLGREITVKTNYFK